MNSVSRFFNGVTMYRLMLYFLLVLVGWAVVASGVGVLPYNTLNILGQALIFVGACWGLNKLLARVFRAQPNVESSLITGLILTAIAGPFLLTTQWWVAVAMAAFAMASKYLITLRRSHIFNPAAFGVIISALVLGYPASWWIGSVATLPVVLVGGLIMVQKIRRFHLVISFLATYLGLLTLDALVMQGRSLSETATFLQNLIVASPLLFFSVVMLIEPLTAPQTRARRIGFGIFVGLLVFGLQRLLPTVPYSFELALLVGNLGARFVSPDFRQAFTLQRKELVGAALGHFWFRPKQAFAFRPGQFLEYTVSHPHPDNRGWRRYFSIASAPTEKDVLLTTKFSEPGSTFKQALRGLQVGGEITASKVAGEFVLPSDQKQKVAFIAGGIGVTPFRSMVKYLLDRGERRDIVLIYAARRAADVVFRDVFTEAEQKLELRAMYVLADEGHMVDAELIQKEVQDFRERVWYVSGPEPMVQGLVKVLAGLNIPRKHIKRDYFPGYIE